MHTSKSLQQIDCANMILWITSVCVCVLWVRQQQRRGGGRSFCGRRRRTLLARQLTQAALKVELAQTAWLSFANLTRAHHNPPTLLHPPFPRRRNVLEFAGVGARTFRNTNGGGVSVLLFGPELSLPRLWPKCE